MLPHYDDEEHAYNGQLRYTVEEYGSAWIAHRDDGHDCMAEDAKHGTSDHPVAALRQLLREEKP